jgi:hypothetical protein
MLDIRSLKEHKTISCRSLLASGSQLAQTPGSISR